ncbi:MAG: beta-galactosidase [Opitutaceae bacterium]|jgi:beta-galactosidase|nr:beta-galactosidase [Opitutaceae bacterium]
MSLLPSLAGSLAYGGDYNPEQWPESVWPEDARLMQTAGVNLVSVGIFAWSRIQKTPTSWDFTWLDRVFDLLHEHGVRVCLATATASPPPWMARLYPDSLPVTAEGVTLHLGARQQFSPCSPDYRRHAAALVRRLGRRYAKHPALAAWHVGNEHACHMNECHGPHSVVAFRAWLKSRYKTIDALNAAWGCAFWSQLYASWDEIHTPRRAPFISNPAQQLDFKRFTSDAFLDLYKMERDILREVSPGVPVTTNLMAFFKPLDYHAWAREMDFTAWDSYPDPALPDEGRHWAAVGHDLTRSLKPGLPFIQMEAATSAVNWRALNRPKPAGLMRLQSLQALARGADGVMFFQWRASLSGAEKYHSAMVSHIDPARCRIHAEVARVGAELKKLAPLAGSTVRARVAIVMDWHAWWALELEARPVKLDYMATLHAVHRAFYEQNLATDFVHPEADLSAYALVVAPVLYLLTEAGAKNLASFAARGGTLLATYATGIVDGQERVVPGGYPGLLRDTLGIWVEEWLPLGDRFANTLSFTGKKPSARRAASTDALACREWTESVHVEDAEVLATFTADLIAGRPALTRRTVGKKGKALYLATGLDAAGWTRLAALAAAEAGVAPVLAASAEVEVSLRESADGARHLFVLNHRHAPVSVSMDKLRGRDLLTDRPVARTLALPALGAAVIRLD